MDPLNRFETPVTFRLLRAEYAAGLLLSAGLMVAHWDAINWLVAVGMFAYIDIFGYLPGAWAHHRAKGRPIHRGYYVLYNTMHSWLTAGAVVALWGWLVHWEWALLAVPVHLCGDRGLLGNFLKPFGVAFEPKAHPAFTTFEQALAAAPEGPGAARPTEVPATVGRAAAAGDTR